jgi:pyroglutamyl-peptidase
MRRQRDRHAGAPARTGVLVTGFGPFPGVPVNATMELLPRLARVAPICFPDVRFTFEVLPTEWAAGPRRLHLLLEEVAPDLALHFGVSPRARGFEVEQRARNACAATPDASGALPAGAAVCVGPEYLPASLPVRHIVARLRRRGIAAFVSRDAGTYLCNAALYHSLLSAKDLAEDLAEDLAKDLAGAHRRVGFVHIPAALARKGGDNRGRLGGCPLTWEQTLAGALEVLATCLRRTQPTLDPLPQASLLSRRAPPRPWARSASVRKPPT